MTSVMVGRPKEFDVQAALERAMEVFWSHGYEATSVQDLVDAMGISRGSMYDTFGDKHALFSAAIEHYERTVTYGLEQMLAAPGSPLVAIRRCLSLLAGQPRSGPCRGCMATGAAVELSQHDPKVAKAVQGILLRVEKAFQGALYVGSGIQNGGYDQVHKIGPAGSELIRILPDDSWELIVGSSRKTPDGEKRPLSGLPPGFGNLFNGYFWSLEAHDGWLYLGTMDSTIWLSWLRLDAYPEHARRLVEGVGVENILSNEAGCDLWRSADGENWIPVTRAGFDNRHNLGIRNLTSTRFGLFVGIANPFGPRVAANRGGRWQYVENPRGGLEIWLGSPRQVTPGSRSSPASSGESLSGPAW